MRLLLAVTDPITLSYAQNLLTQAGIGTLLWDSNMSVIEGSIGILPRRLMVADEDHAAARRILVEAGLSHEIASEKMPE